MEHTVVLGTTVGLSAWAFLRGQLAHLRETGADVHVVSSPDRHLDAAGEREGVAVHGLAMEREISPRADLVALWRWVRLLRRLRPDVVNAGTPKAALLGIVSAWLCRVPVRIYTVRGLRYETATGRRRRVLQAVESLCCALATRVVAVGHGVAEEMLRDRITRREILVIGDGSSNGVRGAEIAAAVDALDRDECRDRFEVPRGDVVVGVVGRLTADKGGDTLVAALDLARSRRPDLTLRLLVVGEAEGKGAGAEVPGMPAGAAATTHTGWLDDPIPAYRAMDVLCLPTRREGFPNVVLEAGAAGLPVVTTDATGARESIVDGETGIRVPVDDVDALADALIRLADDPASRHRMGAAGRARTLERYRPERIWTALEELYAGRVPADTRSYRRG